jgi:hypothetical protein
MSLSRDDLKCISEVWNMLPYSLTQIGDINGQKMYSSKELQNKFLEAISTQKIIKPVYAKIENLIERQIIIPCFTSRNLIDLIKRKFMSSGLATKFLGTTEDFAFEHNVGVYYSNHNKIYIFLDPQTNYIIYMKDIALAGTVLHELMHYASLNLKSKFYDINKESLNMYYRVFYNNYFNSKFSDNILKDIILYMLNKFEWPKNVTTSFLTNFSFHLSKRLEPVMTEKERDEKIVKLLSTVKLYLVDMDSFITSLRNDDSVRSIVKLLVRCYSILGISQPSTLAIQELVFPSEVIAIEAEMNTSSNHYQTIKLL